MKIIFCNIWLFSLQFSRKTTKSCGVRGCSPTTVRIALSLSLSLSLVTADKANGRKKISRERVCFLKADFEGVPGGVPSWDHHQWIER